MAITIKVLNKTVFGLSYIFDDFRKQIALFFDVPFFSRNNNNRNVNKAVQNYRTRYNQPLVILVLEFTPCFLLSDYFFANKARQPTLTTQIARARAISTLRRVECDETHVLSLFNQISLVKELIEQKI